MKIKDIKLYSP